MFSLIAILIPSVLGVKVIDCVIKRLDWKKIVYFYCLLLVISTIINNVIAYLLFNVSSDLLIYLNSYPIFFAKYTIMSIVINIFVAIIIIINIKHLSIDIIVKKNEKTKKQEK